MATNIALYELVDQLKMIQAQADDIDPQTLADTLEGLTGEIEIKAQNVALFAANRMALAGAVMDTADRMKARGQKILAQVEQLQAYIKVQMERSGVKTIEGPQLTLKIKLNPPKAIIDFEGQLPVIFMRQPDPPPPPVPVPDRKKILDALKAGEVVPGAHLEQGSRLEIKP